MITVTDNAIEKFKQQLTKRGSGLGIRISVKTTGCSGLAYVMDFVDSVDETDILIEQDTVKLYIDPEAVQYINGTTLDYQKQGFDSRFNFINPNEAGRCGCGESFTI